MDLEEFALRVRRQTPNWAPPARLLALDPGETMGWALFEGCKLTAYDQVKLKDDPFTPTIALFDKWQPTHVVAEDYKIYGWKAEKHSWSELFTPKLIGAVELLCAQRQLPLKKQMAQLAKGFCKDEKLTMWGIFPTKQRHARDAIRHGAYYLIFDKGVK